MAKKKKRRLRKPIRIALRVMGAALFGSVVFAGIQAVQQEKSEDLSHKIAKTIETAGGVDDLSVSESSDAAKTSSRVDADEDRRNSESVYEPEPAHDEQSDGYEYQTGSEEAGESREEDSQSLNGYEEREENRVDSSLNPDSVTGEIPGLNLNAPVPGASQLLMDPPAIQDIKTDILIQKEAAVLEQEAAEAAELEPVAKILVDAGHGGPDPGMVVSDPDNPGQELYEKDVTLAAALEFEAIMKEINPRIAIETTRDNDQPIGDASVTVYDEVSDLTNRVTLIEMTDSDYFLSLHCNSSSDPGRYGYELYIQPDNPVAADLSAAVSAQFDAAGWSQKSGIITTDAYPLHVVSLAKVPSMLVELGYMSNPDELRALTDPGSRSAAIRALAQAYSDYIMSHLPENQTEASKE